jgi:hypothetical protein
LALSSKVDKLKSTNKSSGERERERCTNDLFVNPTAFCVTEKHAHYLLVPKKVDTNRVLTL